MSFGAAKDIGVGIVIVHSTFLGSGEVVQGALAAMPVTMVSPNGKVSDGPSSKKLDSHSSCVISSSSHYQFLSKNHRSVKVFFSVVKKYWQGKAKFQLGPLEGYGRKSLGP
jgi:hypothetical protein